jgi:hypothetical protein
VNFSYIIIEHNLSTIVLKDQRKRPEGDEWEPIKIHRGNLVYIIKSIRCPSLLARSRPHSYNQAIGPQNWVRNYANTNQCWQEHVRERRQNSDKNHFMSSQAFHRTPCGRVRETTNWEWLELENLEFFDPVAQEHTGFMRNNKDTRETLPWWFPLTRISISWNDHLAMTTRSTN